MLTPLKWLTVILLSIMTHTALAQSATKIRIAYPSGMNGIYPTTMERAGIAKKYGFDPEFTFFQNGPPMMEALASGKVDAVITSLMPVTSFMSRQPGKAVIVAQLGHSSHSLMVDKSSPARSLADLRGKPIAVSFGTDSHLDLLESLKKSGLDPAKDVKLINTPPNELMLALNQDFAEAILVRQPQGLRMQEQFGARAIQTWPFRFVAIMRADYLKENPDAKARFMSALRESVFYVSQNHEQASAWFGEQLRIDPKIVRQVANEDPSFYKLKRVQDVQIDITPAFQKILDDWFKESLEFGLIKEPVKQMPLAARPTPMRAIG